MMWDYFKKTLRWPLIFRPGPISALVHGGARALNQAYEDISWLIRQADPAQCDAEFLHYHATSRGTPRWPDEPEEFYRKRTVNAYAWQKQAGKSRGIEAILNEAGISAEIFEPLDIARMMEPETPRLDGRPLDFLLTIPRAVAGFPGLGWAEFLVNMNWGETGDAQFQLARKIVAEYKAARSLDKFRVYLGLEAPVPDKPESTATAVAGSIIPKPATLCLDGSWFLGTDESSVCLDGRPLDGSWSLGDIESAVITERLACDRVETSCHGAINLEIKPGESNLKQEPIRMTESIQRLDGTWDLGVDVFLDGTWVLDGKTKLDVAPRLGPQPDYRLDGKWNLGPDDPVCTSWPSVY